MKVEIERKFLLSSISIIDTLRELGVNLKKSDITQIYTKIEKNEEVRIRKEDDNFIMSAKKGQGLQRQEENTQADEKLFNLAKKNKIGQTIKKRRYYFEFEGLKYSIDVYKNFKNLVVLEIEFEDTKSANAHVLPPLLAKEVQKEVTDDETYKNKNLALYGTPNFEKKEDLGVIFKKIKDDVFGYDFLSSLPDGIESYNGMRTIFYALKEKIAFHQNEYIKSRTNESLHQFRVNIRKTRSLLQSIEDVFEQGITQRFIKNLKYIANETNQKRDMDVFKEYLEGLDEMGAEEILAVIQTKKEQIDNKLFDVLKGVHCQRVMDEWDVVVNDEDRFFIGKNGNLSLKKVASNAISRRLKKMKNALQTLDEGAKLHDFHSVRIEFKKLRYLCEFFEPFLQEAQLEQMMRLSKKMQNLFGKLQDRDVAREILKSFESDEGYASNVLIIYACEEIQEVVVDEIYELRSKILTGKKRLFKVLNATLEDLKIYI